MVQQTPYFGQFQGVGSQIFEHNTFLECADIESPKPPLLESGWTARAMTTPPLAPDGLSQVPEAHESTCRGQRRGDHVTTAAMAATAERHQAKEDAARGRAQGLDLPATATDAARPAVPPAPPSPGELIRVRTFDPFEDEALTICESTGPSEGLDLSRMKTFDPFEEQWPIDQGWSGAYPGGFEASPFMMMPVQVPMLEAPAGMPGSAAVVEWLPTDGPPSGACPSHVDEHLVPPAFGAPPATAAAPAAVSTQTPSVPQPQTLSRSHSTASGAFRVSWTVDARKLHGNERVAVSPPFEISCPSPMTFKMMILPKATSDRRGSASFRKSGGRGIVQVKCEAQATESSEGCLTFSIMAGKNLEDAKRKPPRRSVKHDFTKSVVCTLQDEQEGWDFGHMVDEASQTFVVCLETL
uniref:Uncharacterized protein n=1 Tax=Pyrodinium bahamense TaxID=73915 RepID=A0A7S0BA40_9DINO|mmetsp:Transcript_6709/g.18414  ORF Transcript_6709/g.18414 Transcript_6709/m.18414 type:complete len:411 (+) Transcript_6709:83-1315(+)